MIASAFLGAAQYKDSGLKQIMDILQTTMEDLEVDLQVINLYEKNIPYYTGAVNKDVSEMINTIKLSDFIVLATSVELYAPCAVMKNLLDHCQNEGYKGAFFEKRVFVISVSKTKGEIDCANYMSRAVGLLGGIESGRIAIGGNEQQLIGVSEEMDEKIEKHIEDFYRAARQAKNYFLPSEGTIFQTSEKSYKKPAKITKEIKSHFISAEPQIDFQAFDQKQSKDIEELAQFFSKKIDTKIEADYTGVYKKPKAAVQPTQTTDIIPKSKTAKQLTQNLIHYFKPHLSGDLQAIYQININGDEEFNCFITIDKNHCEYSEGHAENAEIVILAHSDIWVNVLKGKFTAQNAFMTGRLKVRGNFILLNKFDQLFKIGD